MEELKLKYTVEVVVVSRAVAEVVEEDAALSLAIFK